MKMQFVACTSTAFFVTATAAISGNALLVHRASGLPDGSATPARRETLVVFMSFRAQPTGNGRDRVCYIQV